MSDQAAAPRQQRPIAGNSTRGVAAVGANHAAEDETSRNIGSACLPLRACRPSGGFVLGTLARVPAPVKQVSSSARPFSAIPMSTACGQRCGNDVHLWVGVVECVPTLRVSERERCGNLLFTWSVSFRHPNRVRNSDYIDGYGELVVAHTTVG